MRTLVLTGEDMADLIAGSTINAMLEDGEEVLVVAPDGLNKNWRKVDERDVANAESNRILAERKEQDDMPMRPTGPRGCPDCGAPPYSYHAGICEED